VLLHQVPDEPKTFDFLASYNHQSFTLNITGLMNTGAGLAYRVDNSELWLLHKTLNAQFKQDLILQDRQRFWPHITVMNKLTVLSLRFIPALINY